ncbi:MAG: hypothetical protein WC444_06810 [Candidatus Paceibacterota bacterium]
MTRITLDTISVKLDIMHEDLRELKCQEKLNTEFRQKATGIIGFATVCAGTFGAFIVWVGAKMFAMFGGKG